MMCTSYILLEASELIDKELDRESSVVTNISLGEGEENRRKRSERLGR